jgi:hypothetical protein
MGKSSSKVEKEEIIIAQNGAGNSASATETIQHRQLLQSMEMYSTITVVILCLIVGYFLWRRCKDNYGSYMRRELHELPTCIVEPTTGGEVRRSRRGRAPQQVIG